MSVVERMRPLLGTFVTIRVEATADITQAHVESAVECAFRAISRVNRLMSFHRRSSDIGRLNRARPGACLRVHSWTYQVLREAQRLWHWSGGAFDCNVGVPLMRSGLLPKATGGYVCRRHRPCAAAIHLRHNRTVRLNTRVALDLGGIAKGFAVDKAVEALLSHGVKCGLVNAGGDLRVFGSDSQPVWVRRPEDPTRVQMIGALTNGAVATSASYYTGTSRPGEATASAIVDTTCGRRVSMTSSVSVIAQTCMLADALTKIAILKGRLPAHFARHAHARIVTL
ncbi:FAD:protein FMN transferase [Sulfuriferula plumbiphila]|uniref:FAD:protein FMN transferase n=1 Tax=Sulfuriferula plumbiphila TaxID=171865 RepID=A0A512L9C4_9PROT|nr:FAD:protein FMN transferase [Sulfuriferula plumbiphila]BBP02990.1 FAD:protein FMN transferase [Sulfuriferula plumbiphila]GEP31088.1 FAD:protein FMN transferase [Sulfuriferula plumbiphila]